MGNRLLLSFFLLSIIVLATVLPIVLVRPPESSFAIVITNGTTTTATSTTTSTLTTTSTTTTLTSTTSTTTPSATCACTRVVDNTFSFTFPESQRAFSSNADATLLASNYAGLFDASYFLRLYDSSTQSPVYPAYQLLLGGGWTSFLVGYSISPHVDMLGRYYWMGNVQTPSVNFGIARLTSGGLLDTSYGTGGRITLSTGSLFEMTERGPVDPLTGVFAVSTSLSTVNNYAEIDIFSGAVTTSTVSISYPSLSDFYITAVRTGLAGGTILLSSGAYACWVGTVVFLSRSSAV